VGDFLATPDPVVMSSLADHHVHLMRTPPSASQAGAWRDELRILRATLRDVAVASPDAVTWGVVLEYELPLEGGRRPDVVILAGGSLVVIEFKGELRLDQAFVDQVSAYTRDLNEYHAASHSLRGVPVLLMTRAHAPVPNDHVTVVDPASLASVLLDVATGDPVDLDAWLNAEYAPLPMLVTAARRIFQNEPLPAIKRALATSVPDAVELLGRLAEDASQHGRRVLAFVAGVPGSGKTLAGLSLVYERTAKMSASTFLSGNGPLVEVLRDALQSKVFVRDLHAFITTYGLSTKVPREQVIVFDEAQRAWDTGYMQHKHGVGRSEPDLLIDVGERLPGWATLVGLVGDGQEIHSGEESGMQQWDEAISPSRGRTAWSVHCPPRLKLVFTEVEATGHDVLDLTVSLRSRRAERFHDWVAALLDGRLGEAARLAAVIQADHFPMHLTRDLDQARRYVWSMYEDHPDKRYGLLASARSQTYLPKYGVDSSFPATKRVKLARWYNEGRGHPQSCCELRDVVTEFGCQGLELDLPILCWANDMMWDGRGWKVRAVRPKYPLNDPEQIRRNAYRVLLTRGRDGLVVYIPDDPAMDPTEHALLAAGVRPLPAPVLVSAGV
jgi:hypothetical protein